MKYFLILLTFAFTSVQASGKHDLEFTAQPVQPIKIVQWIVTENLEEVCQGHAPIKDRKYIACTRFNNERCIVYTRPDLTLSILGHEMRHCFEGHWHK